MPTKESSSEERDVLSDIRKIEAHKRQVLLAKKVNELKNIAKRINELKAESEILLDEMRLSKEDSKRVIDFVNELDDVKLTEEERLAIRTRVKGSVQKEKTDVSVEVEKAISKYPFQGHAEYLVREKTFLNGLKVGGQADWAMYSGTTAVNTNVCNSLASAINLNTQEGFLELSSGNKTLKIKS